VGFVALDLLGIAVDDAHLNPAVRGALAADSRLPDCFARKLGGLPDALDDELLFVRASIQ
jgi:hypothetical protein